MSRKQLFNSEFLKHSSVLIGGTLLAQLIPILLQPVLRRMFTPDEFGVMAVYFSIVSIVCVIASLNYQAAVVLPEEEEDAMAIVLGGVVISAIVSIVVFIVLLLFSDGLLHFFRLPSGLKNWLCILPVSIFLNSIHLIFGNWLTRKKAFKAFAINKVSRRMAEGIAQLGLGLKWKSGGLILGTFFGDLVNGLTYFWQYRQTGGAFRGSVWGRVKKNLLRYKQFPLVSLAPNLLSTVSLFIPVLLITQLYSTEITGQFDLSRQILALPLSLISVSVSQVLVQKLSESRKNGTSVLPQMRNIFLVLTGLSLVGCLVVFIFGEALFSWIFGEQWRFSGAITELLVWSYGIKFIVAPLAIAFIAFEKLLLNSIWQMAYFVAMAALYMLPKLEFTDFLYLLIGIDVFFYVIYGLLTYYIVIDYEKKKHDRFL